MNNAQRRKTFRTRMKNAINKIKTSGNSFARAALMLSFIGAMAVGCGAKSSLQSAYDSGARRDGVAMDIKHTNDVGAYKPDSMVVPNPKTALLRIFLERNATTFLASKYIPGGPCTLKVPHLYIDAPVGATKHFEVTKGSNGPGHDTSFYVATNGGDCNGQKFELGTVFIRLSPGSEAYTMHQPKDTPDGVAEVQFPFIGKESGDSWGGRIRMGDAAHQEVGPLWKQLVPSLKMLIGITEYVADNPPHPELVDIIIFGVKGEGTSSSLNFDLFCSSGDCAGKYGLKKDHLLYRLPQLGYKLVSEGFKTGRGSVVKKITNDEIQIMVVGSSEYKK